MVGKTIVQRIALEGGEAIKSQLEAIGLAGQKAFKDIVEAAKATPAIRNFSENFDAIKKKAAEIGTAFNDLGNSFNKFGDSILTSGRNIGFIAVAIGGAVAGFVALIKSAADTSDALSVTADSVGLTTKQLSELQFAATQAGLSSDELTKALLRINKAFDAQIKEGDALGKKQRDLNFQFAQGKIKTFDYAKQLLSMKREASEGTTALDRLGFQITKNADGTVNQEKSLHGLMDAFKAFPEGATKSGLAMEILGGRNAKATQFLNQGSEALKRQQKEAQRVAPALDKLSESVNLKLNDAFDTLKKASDSASLSVRSVFSPLLLDIVEELTESIVRNRTNLVLWAAQIAKNVRPIVDDLIATLQGRDADVKDPFFIKARDAIISFGVEFKKAWTEVIFPLAKRLLQVLDGIAKAINFVFGTNVTGTQLAISAVILKVTGLFGVLRGAIGIVVAGFRLFIAIVGGATAAIAVLGFSIGFLVGKAVLALDDALGRKLSTSIKTTISVLLNLPAVIVGVFKLMGAAIQLAWQGAVAFVGQKIEEIKGFFANLPQVPGQIWTALVEFIKQKWAEGVAFVGQKIEEIKGFFASLPDRVSEVWELIKQAVFEKWQGVVDFIGQKIEEIKTFFKNLPDQLKEFVQNLPTAIGQFFKDLFEQSVEFGKTKLKELGTAVDNFLATNFPKLKAFIDLLKAGAEKLGITGGKAADTGAANRASGGPVYGPGTSRSDSIPAFLSNNEFVQQARAVWKYGLPFMHALNKGLIPVDAIRALMGGLSLDGVAGLFDMSPRRGYAGGGLAVQSAGGGSQAVHFHLDGQEFPATMESNVVKSLTRSFNKSSITSAGRKPSWHRG